MASVDTGLVILLVLLWACAVAAVRKPLQRWRLLVLTAGIAVAAAALISGLDEAGRRGLVTAHIAQHMLLGDVAAALIVLGLPTAWSRSLATRLGHWANSATSARRWAAQWLAPVGALVAWVVASYWWFIPGVHQQAMSSDVAHVADHASFLLFGMLIWFQAFDPRWRRRGTDGLRFGGMPWWGRHLYAMTTRTALLLPAAVLWLADPSSYHPDGDWSFSTSQAADSSNAASLMVGFEMSIFAAAVVLAAIFLIVHDGRHGHHGW